MMTPEKKIRSLTFIIVFLLVTNIVMLLFFIFSKPAVHSSPAKDENLVATFLQQQIGFDEQQMDLYQKVRKNDFEKNKPAFEALKQAKNSFYQHIYSDSLPDSIINKSAAVIGKKQIDVDTKMLLHFKKVRGICTGQQRPKFDSLFKNVIAKITARKIKKRSNAN